MDCGGVVGMSASLYPRDEEGKDSVHALQGLI